MYTHIYISIYTYTNIQLHACVSTRAHALSNCLLLARSMSLTFARSLAHPFSRVRAHPPYLFCALSLFLSLSHSPPPPLSPPTHDIFFFPPLLSAPAALWRSISVTLCWGFNSTNSIATFRSVAAAMSSSATAFRGEGSWRSAARTAERITRGNLRSRTSRPFSFRPKRSSFVASRVHKTAAAPCVLKKSAISILRPRKRSGAACTRDGCAASPIGVAASVAAVMSCAFSSIALSTSVVVMRLHRASWSLCNSSAATRLPRRRVLMMASCSVGSTSSVAALACFSRQCLQPTT